jgi:hypothetical protein
MARLAARPPTRRIPAALGRPGRILTGWLGRVTRRALGLALKPSDALVLLSDPLLKLGDLLVHPQQHRHHDVTPLLEDRLRLRPLHSTRFDAAPLCPPTD